MGSGSRAATTPGRLPALVALTPERGFSREDCARDWWSGGYCTCVAGSPSWTSVRKVIGSISSFLLFVQVTFDSTVLQGWFHALNPQGSPQQNHHLTNADLLLCVESRLEDTPTGRPESRIQRGPDQSQVATQRSISRHASLIHPAGSARSGQAKSSPSEFQTV